MMAAFGQKTKEYFQHWGRSGISDGCGDKFLLASILYLASFPSDTWVAAVPLSFHVNCGGNKYFKSLLSGRNSASREYQLLCLSLFQLAQLWAAEQPVWMTRGGIPSSDITRCACGRKVNLGLVIALQWTVQNWLQVRKRCCESVVPIFAYLELSGAFVWKCQQWGEYVCTCLALILWVLRWLEDLTWAHNVCIAPCHPFPSLPPSSWSRSRIVPSLQSWPWCFPLAAANSQGELRRSSRPICLLASCADSCSLSSLKHLLILLLLTPRSPRVLRLKHVYNTCFCHILSFECCQALNIPDIWQQGVPQVTSVYGEFSVLSKPSIQGQDPLGLSSL